MSAYRMLHFFLRLFLWHVTDLIGCTTLMRSGAGNLFFFKPWIISAVPLKQNKTKPLKNVRGKREKQPASGVGWCSLAHQYSSVGLVMLCFRCGGTGKERMFKLFCSKWLVLNSFALTYCEMVVCVYICLCTFISVHTVRRKCMHTFHNSANTAVLAYTLSQDCSSNCMS